MSLKEQMLAHLGSIYANLVEGWQDSAEIAIYWFAVHHYMGMGDELYTIISTSPYSPGRVMTLAKEDEIVRGMYDDLEAAYNV